MNQPIIILGAVDEEIAKVRDHLTDIEQHQHGLMRYETGNFEGLPVVLSRSGLGKVASAMTAQHLIDRFPPAALIFTGVGGALNNALQVGDVVVARDTVQHDLDGIGLGFTRGTVPYTDQRFFKTDDRLFQLAMGAELTNTRIFSGRIATGDIFLTAAHTTAFAYLQDEFQADVVEMEGAAVGQVCTWNQIPYLVIRTISDKANAEATHDFNTFMPVVAKNSFGMLTAVLRGCM
jgi:5'-methylthioadenosine/S-adenosylhomocysteine nucleosidase